MNNFYRLLYKVFRTKEWNNFYNQVNKNKSGKKNVIQVLFAVLRTGNVFSIAAAAGHTVSQTNSRGLIFLRNVLEHE